MFKPLKKSKKENNFIGKENGLRVVIITAHGQLKGNCFVAAL